MHTCMVTDVEPAVHRATYTIERMRTPDYIEILASERKEDTEKRKRDKLGEQEKRCNKNA